MHGLGHLLSMQSFAVDPTATQSCTRVWSLRAPPVASRDTARSDGRLCVGKGIVFCDLEATILRTSLEGQQ